MSQSITMQHLHLPECTLEPLLCFHCERSEVLFHPYVGDAFCPTCERWQLESAYPETV